MKEFVAYIVKNLVDHRDQVSIRETEGSQALIIELTVEKTDIGKVIGKRGRTIRAIRTLLMSVASRHGVRVSLEVIEEGRRISTEQEEMIDESNQESREAVFGAGEQVPETTAVATRTSDPGPETQDLESGISKSAVEERAHHESPVCESRHVRAT